MFFLLKGLFSGAGIKSYTDPNFLFPFTPNFASGCLASSSIWNSQPIAEPSPLFKSGLTKYLIPLFAPSVILKSTFRIKFLSLLLYLNIRMLESWLLNIVLNFSFKPLQRYIFYPYSSIILGKNLLGLY